MPHQEQLFRPPLYKRSSYSSLKGLEVAVPPRYKTESSETGARYVDKPLPSLPPKASNLHAIRIGDLISVFDSSVCLCPNSAVLEINRDRQKPIEIKQQIGHNPGVDQTPQMIARVIDSGIETLDRPFMPEPKSVRFMKLDEGFDSGITSNMDDIQMSDSAFSVGSSSDYNEEDDLEDIVDHYKRRSIWLSVDKPRIAEAERGLYLQPGRHCASACELGSLDRPAEFRLPFRSIIHGDSPMKAVTLDELIKAERERSETIGLEKISMQLEQTNATFTKEDSKLPKMDLPALPSWAEYDETVRSMTAQAMSRSKKAEAPARCVSRFSDRSSEAEAPAGVISTARNSIVLHIRNIPKTFSSSNRPPVVFREKTVVSSIKIPSPELVKRKRGLTSDKHPLKSPFLFSPLRKKAHIDDYPTSNGTNLVHRFSGGQKSPTIQSRIISNYTRSFDGPDTPMPTKSETWSIISLTAVFHKSSLQLQNAIGRAKCAARIRSKDERKRDKLRKQIFVLGAANQTSGDQWV